MFGGTFSQIFHIKKFRKKNLDTWLLRRLLIFLKTHKNCKQDLLVGLPLFLFVLVLTSFQLLQLDS